MTQENAGHRTIVVGMDASPGAAAALRWAIQYARLSDVEVVAVHAFQAPVAFADPYGGTLPDTIAATLREGVRRCFEEDWCAPLAAAGVRHREVMEDGRAARVLLDVADREEAVLVVTGRRGLNTLSELMLGSVSHNLVHASKRPVVLVPAAETVVTDSEPRQA
jgi:nucleotide-binding universal stress UspA family protein